MRTLLPWLLTLALPVMAQTQRPVAALPMEVRTHGLYVHATVNDSRLLQLELDTAAGWHVLNWPVAEAAKLSLKEHASGAQGAGDGRTRAAQILEATIRLGSLDVPFTPAAAIHLDSISDRKGITLDGLLGAPLLKRYVVEANVDEGELRLYDPATWRYKGSGQELAVRVDGHGVPYLTLPFELPDGRTVSGEFKIDSAAGGTTLYFAAPFAGKHGVMKAVAAGGGRRLEEEVFGVGGSSRLWLVRMPGVRLGRWKFENVVAGVVEAKGGTLAGSDIAGIIGGGLMHRFNVTYDCPRGRIYLEPAKGLTGSFEEDMSGLRWLNVGAGRKEFHVRAVRHNSPAGRAGLKAGDVLLEVDGQAASRFDRDRLNRLLKQEGRTVRMRVRRGPEQATAVFRLERMI